MNTIMKTVAWTALIVIAAAILLLSRPSAADQIGKVDTKFNLLRPDDSINIESFTDPKVDGVVCYLSRAQKGGFKGAIGIAEDTSDASIDCRQIAPIKISKAFKKGESIFRERRSLIFKSLKVIRFCDTEHNALVYLVYSERVIEGSPKNSISAVPIQRWQVADNKPLAVCTYNK